MKKYAFINMHTGCSPSQGPFISKLRHLSTYIQKRVWAGSSGDCLYKIHCIIVSSPKIIYIYIKKVTNEQCYEIRASTKSYKTLLLPPSIAHPLPFISNSNLSKWKQQTVSNAVTSNYLLHPSSNILDSFAGYVQSAPIETCVGGVVFQSLHLFTNMSPSLLQANCNTITISLVTLPDFITIRTVSINYKAI